MLNPLYRIVLLTIIGSLVFPGLVPAQSQSQSNASQQTISVRGGEDNGRSRIVFDWPSVVSYKTIRAATQLTLTFENPATYNTRRLYLNRLSRVTGFKADTNGRAVILSLTPNSAETIFRVGNRLVIDFRQGDVKITKQPEKPDATQKISAELRHH